ncbi:DUF6233 domain-containing protein [Streptomyces justiciae]|uniref:DUF6233 domain-containing protein n=1 Tax=Streptomyces justiciae TaxID=2780140 RepID=A0ABU3M6U4_9ACTN|nr:DUF6233 domain-containing protein [Streptomyces justiciae]MDT7847229.1 DUF6233 domain-containing protein [Streptomyces justiciae]
MNDLPPDSARLRAILEHLDKQIADNETVATYLRLQRDAVQAALARAEPSPARPRRSGRLAKGAAPLRSLGIAHAQPRPRFVVQQKRTPRGPEPSIIHVADCTMIEGTPHSITAHDARVALTDPTIEPCGFCRPDTELGILD